MTHIRAHLRIFYALVLLIALAGQALAAREWLGWPLLAALAAVAGVEFGGVVLSMHADERRRLGERALPARVLAAAVAAGAVALNWLGHDDHLVGGFFAGMSALGFSVWLIVSAARRRDALRRAGMLPPTPPVYGVVQWLRHPWLTRRARQLALRDPSLGLYGSLSTATAAVRSERRQAAIATELRQMIAAAAGPTMATVAVNTFDMDEIAHRLAASADYDGLASRLAAQLTPAALAPEVSRSLPREESPRDDLDRELSHGETVERRPAGADDSAPRPTGADDLVTNGSGDRLPDEEVSQVGHLNDGNLFDLAATLADRPHYPLPREAVDQVRGGTTVPPAADGQHDSLSLAGLFAGGTWQTDTPAAAVNGRSNGAHMTAIPPATLALAERPEPANDAGHGDGHLTGHDDLEMTASVTAESAPDGGHDAGQNGAEMTADPPDSTRPNDGHDGGQNDRHDDRDPTATEPVSRAAKKLSANERKVAQALDRTPDATVADLAKRTRVSERTVRRIRAKLQAHADTSGIAS